MRAAARGTVVTSGRLTGGVRVQPARRRVTPKPGPAACPELAYSLYSTDSEDQVTSLHKGLDGCAALLSGILQAEKAGASRSLPRAVKGGAAKSRASTSLGKKTIKKLPTKTDQKSCGSVQRGAGSTPPTTTHQSAVPAARSQVKLHPPQNQPHLPPSHSPTLQHLSPTTPPPQTCIPPLQTSAPPPETSTPPSQTCIPPLQTCTPPPLPIPQTQAKCEREEEEFVPVRDTDTQSSATDTHTALTHTHSHIHTCSMKMSNMQLEPGQVDKVPQDTHREDCSAETEVKVRTVQYLLGELKALIAGQGSVAERLLSHLEQTVSSPLMNVGGSNIQTETDLSSLHSQNTQLRRRVRFLNQQLKEREKAERQQNVETLCNSEVLTLQEELTTAQSRLQELQQELKEVRKALQDTQSQLRDREAEKAVMETDLQATSSRLLDSEREKRELASLAQQRLEEIGNLNRIVHSRDSSDCPTVVDSSVSDTQHLNQHQQRQDPAEPPTDRITQYLMSLGQLEPAERGGNTLEQKKLTSVQLRDTPSHPDVSQRGDRPAETSASSVFSHQNSPLHQSHGRLSQCEEESVWSDWSTRSGSISSRDEAAFRDGLAALDASIASLQKTIQLDLRR